MPALSPERLARHLQEGARGGVFFIHGEEDYLQDRAVREIVGAHLDPGTRDFNLDEVRGSDVSTETLGSLIQTPPMMAEWRVVVVRETQAMVGSSTARGILEEVAASPPPGLAVVLVADTGGSSAKIWKTLEKEAAVAVKCDRLSDGDLPGWLMAWAEAHGFEVDAGAARALAAAVGPGLAPLARELEKLREFVGDGRPVTREDVERVVGAIPRQDRWEWMDLVAERKFDQAREGLPILLETGGESGVGLVIGLGNQFLRIALCVVGGKGALEAELSGRQKWLARRIIGQARQWSEVSVRDALRDLERADRLLKSAPLSDFQIMDELLLRLRHRVAA